MDGLFRISASGWIARIIVRVNTNDTVVCT